MQGPIEPAVSAILDRIHDASRESEWLPAAMLTLLCASLERKSAPMSAFAPSSSAFAPSSSAFALPRDIVRHVHSFLHLPLTRCQCTDKEYCSIPCLRSGSCPLVDSCQCTPDRGKSLAIVRLDLRDCAAHIIVSVHGSADVPSYSRISLTSASVSFYRDNVRVKHTGPHRWLRATDAFLADLVTRAVDAMKWCLESSGDRSPLARFFAVAGDDLRGIREMQEPSNSLQSSRVIHVFSDRLLIEEP